MKLDREQLTREPLAVTGAANVGMLENFGKMPSSPAGFIERFQRNIEPASLVDRIVPIYMKPSTGRPSSRRSGSSRPRMASAWSRRSPP
jgi:hypothetical protein